MSPWRQLLWNPLEMQAVEPLHVSSRHTDMECSCTSTTNFALQHCCNASIFHEVPDFSFLGAVELLMSFLGSNLMAVDVMLHLLLFVGSHSPSPFGGKFDNYFHGVRSGESLLQFSSVNLQLSCRSLYKLVQAKKVGKPQAQPARSKFWQVHAANFSYCPPFPIDDICIIHIAFMCLVSMARESNASFVYFCLPSLPMTMATKIQPLRSIKSL